MRVNKQQSLNSDCCHLPLIDLPHAHLFITFFPLIRNTFDTCASLALSSPSSSPSSPHYLIFASHPVILKVVATLLKNSSPSAELMEVRRLFLSDMIKLFSNSRENRR